MFVDFADRLMRNSEGLKLLVFFRKHSEFQGDNIDSYYCPTKLYFSWFFINYLHELGGGGNINFDVVRWRALTETLLFA